MFLSSNAESKPSTVSQTRVEQRYRSNHASRKEQQKTRKGSKKKRNLDLQIVCNDGTINTNKTMDNFEKESRYEDAADKNLDYHEEVKFPMMIGRTLTLEC